MATTAITIQRFEHASTDSKVSLRLRRATLLVARELKMKREVKEQQPDPEALPIQNKEQFDDFEEYKECYDEQYQEEQEVQRSPEIQRIQRRPIPRSKYTQNNPIDARNESYRVHGFIEVPKSKHTQNNPINSHNESYEYSIDQEIQPGRTSQIPSNHPIFKPSTHNQRKEFSIPNRDSNVKISKSGLVMKSKLSDLEQMRDETELRLQRAFKSMMRKNEDSQVLKKEYRRTKGFEPITSRNKGKSRDSFNVLPLHRQPANSIKTNRGNTSPPAKQTSYINNTRQSLDIPDSPNIILKDRRCIDNNQNRNGSQSPYTISYDRNSGTSTPRAHISPKSTSKIIQNTSPSKTLKPASDDAPTSTESTPKLRTKTSKSQLIQTPLKSPTPNLPSPTTSVQMKSMVNKMMEMFQERLDPFIESAHASINSRLDGVVKGDDDNIAKSTEFKEFKESFPKDEVPSKEHEAITIKGHAPIITNKGHAPIITIHPDAIPTPLLLPHYMVDKITGGRDRRVAYMQLYNESANRAVIEEYNLNNVG